MRHRISNPTAVALCAAGVAFAASACALMSKAELVDIRYFSPERVKSRRTGEDPVLVAPLAAPNGPLQLRLGRVSSGPNLRERIAYRDAAYELGYYQDLRWTERPETYVRRALGRSLFEAHGLHRVLSGEAPTLDVEVIAFDDLRLKTERAARVQLNVILYQGNNVILEDTLTVDHPVAGQKPEIEDVIAAMAAALDAVADQVALRVQKALAERRSASLTNPAP
jgi:cholesterol transport system auxiliary component